MNNPELVVLLLNCTVIAVAYFLIYPKFCGSNGYKIATNDLFASGIVLFISGCLFWGAGIEFNLLFAKVNWFWFTLISYAIIETPLMLWYYKRNNVWGNFNT